MTRGGRRRSGSARSHVNRRREFNRARAHDC